MKRNLKQNLALFISLLLILSIFLVSCGAAGKDSVSNSKSEYITESGSANDMDGNGSLSDKITNSDSGSDSEITSDQKLVKRVSLTLQTKNFEEAIKEIEDYTKQFGGYIENSSLRGGSSLTSTVERSAVYVIRIPADKLDNYIDNTSKNMNVVYKQQSIENITENYYDTKARLNSLKLQEERLLAMLENAAELEYMLQLESALADVRYQIESYTSQMNRFDSLVSYATVTITLDEVVEYKAVTEPPKTYGERLSTAIGNSWKDFVDFLEDASIEFVYAFPALIVIVLIAGIAVIITRVIIKKRKNRNNNISSTENNDIETKSEK